MTDDNFGSGYGRSYVGMIMDHNDPKMMGRYLVKWHSIQEGLNNDELQWCTHRANQGQGTKNQGMFFGLREGATVTGHFQDGDSQMGMITGVHVAGDTSNSSGNSMQTGGQKKYQPDLPAAAMTGDGSSGGSQAQQDMPSADKTDKVRYPRSTYNSQYPFHDVIKGEGYEFHLDNTPGSERIRISHVSGSHQEWSSTGKYTQMTTDHHITYTKGGSTHSNDGNHDEKHDEHFRSSITKDAHHEIAGDHQQAHGLESKQIHGGDTVSLTGGDTVHGGVGNEHKSYGGNSIHKVDGGRTVNTKGNYQTSTAGNNGHKVDGSHSETVGKDVSQNIGGSKSISMGGSKSETAGGNRTIVTMQTLQHSATTGAAIACPTGVAVGPGASPGSGVPAPPSFFV